jgi:hypothetical protein
MEVEVKTDQELEKLILEDDEPGNEVPEDQTTAVELGPTKPNFSTLEVIARITDNKIETREIVDKWLLLTFDIPISKEGNKARTEFYKEAYRLGAVQNTESVYLTPWTPQAELMALKLAEVSNSRVIVWTAQTSAEQAQEITHRYDKGLMPILKLVEKRIDTLDYFIQKGYHKRAQRYTIKTERILNDLEAAIIRRGSAQMLILISILKTHFGQAFGRI